MWQAQAGTYFLVQMASFLHQYGLDEFAVDVDIQRDDVALELILSRTGHMDLEELVTLCQDVSVHLAGIILVN